MALSLIPAPAGVLGVMADLQVCQSDGIDYAMLRYRKSPRLLHFDYAGNYAYFLTIVTRRRRHVFSDHAVVQQVAVAMERAALKHRFEVHAYCFMPDHLHLLLSGESDSSLTEFVRQFKQISSFEYKHRHGMQLWQISYYDRVLRSDEDLDSVARYIWGNPVKAGIVADPADYAFSGPRPLPESWV